MNSVGMFSIGGIASGLDTEGMITQLMQLEKLPVRRMETAQQQLRARDDAWGQVNTRLSALRAAVDKINRPDRFTSLIKATSSNEAAVTVTSRAGSETGSLSFAVDQLAQAHQVRTTAVGDPAAALDGTSFSVTVGDTTVDVDLTGGRSLQDVARELNAAKAGFSATVVKAGDGAHHLVLTSAKTGEANAVSVTTDVTVQQEGQQVAMAVSDLQAAQDAEVRLGTGPDALVVTRASNTIDDLVPGASVTLRKVTAPGEAPVTVTTARDVDGGVAAVKEYVTALNGVIDTLSKLTGYDAAAGKGGVLQGDSTARRMLDQLRSTVTTSTGLPTDGLHSAYQVGLNVDRNGAVVLDETKLRAALEQNFDGVARLFGSGATASAPGATVTTTAATIPGAHEVHVTEAATRTRAAATVIKGNHNPIGVTHFRITVGDKAVDLQLPSMRQPDPDPQLADRAQQFNEALVAAGITTVTAVWDAGTDELSFTSSRYGSAHTFTIEQIDAAGGEPVAAGTVFGLEAVVDGRDVQGTIGGVEATGDGQRLTATSGAANGLSVTWTGPAGGDPFTVNVTRGLAGGLGDVLRTMEGSGGSVARARQGLTSQIKVYQDRIDAFDIRLTTRESTLRRQFTAMESALAQANAQGSWLQSQLGGLQNLHRQQ